MDLRRNSNHPCIQSCTRLTILVEVGVGAEVVRWRDGAFSASWERLVSPRCGSNPVLGPGG
jgi:hypothetical protein